LAFIHKSGYRSFEDELFEAHPEISAKAIHYLHEISVQWASELIEPETFKSTCWEVFNSLTTEQLAWFQVHTAENTLWGTITREVMAERILLEDHVEK
jgi:hypothetical protein